jgi:hypothetical protein
MRVTALPLRLLQMADAECTRKQTTRAWKAVVSVWKQTVALSTVG